MHPVIPILVKEIQTFPNVKQIILFGSRARGDNEERSDIDLAINCPQATKEEWTKIWSLVDDAPTLLHIDLVRMDKASDTLLTNIQREGTILYDNSK